MTKSQCQDGRGRERKARGIGKLIKKWVQRSPQGRARASGDDRHFDTCCSVLVSCLLRHPHLERAGHTCVCAPTNAHRKTRLSSAPWLCAQVPHGCPSCLRVGSMRVPAQITFWHHCELQMVGCSHVDVVFTTHGVCPADPGNLAEEDEGHDLLCPATIWQE